MECNSVIVDKVCDTVIQAGSTLTSDKIAAYNEALNRETNAQSKWVMETILKNAEVAERNRCPLCDDTGIPHILLEIGSTVSVTGAILESIQEGVRQGLRKLPGRPMAVMGDDMQRIAQSSGMFEDPGMVETAPILIRTTQKNEFRVHVLLFGGGPAIQGHTLRVYHKHTTREVENQIVEWANESVKKLGCSPCTLAVGIGRSHYEAASLVLQALVDGRCDCQSDIEQRITRRVNESNVGALGLGGDTTVLTTFLKVGPQRASGVRIVSLRPCCCFEPRIASCRII